MATTDETRPLMREAFARGDVREEWQVVNCHGGVVKISKNGGDREWALSVQKMNGGTIQRRVVIETSWEERT